MQMKGLLEKIIEVATHAGKKMLEAKTPEVYTKEGHANFVTNMDIEVQQLIVASLMPLLEQASFIGEESQNAELTDDLTWVIDPIDGTNNFMNQYQHSAVSIALLQKKEPIAGVVYNPYLDEIFYAAKGEGAFCNQKQIKVSEKDLYDAIIGFGTSPYYLQKADESFSYLQKLYFKSRDIRRSGSAALDLCYVACGRTDGFFELCLSPWDYAAASVILTEAGGKIGSFEDQTMGYDRARSIVAGNETVFMKMKQMKNA